MSAPDLKRAAAERAIPLVEDGMRLGIGTGSTAAAFIKLLGERVRAGLKVTGVPTSEATRIACEREGIPLATLEDLPELDLTIDGADEVDDQLRLIKGGGAALLREKIVACASRRMVVIADAAKHVARLGAFPLPIEVNPFGLKATHRAVEAAVAAAETEEDRTRLQRELRYWHTRAATAELACCFPAGADRSASTIAALSRHLHYAFTATEKNRSAMLGARVS